MSAERLREAAALMRERARSTSRPLAWTFLIAEGDGDLWGIVRGGVDIHRYTVAECDYSNDAEHIASWHPAVALAVHDLLATIAEWRGNPADIDLIQATADALADAYLGGTP